MTLSNRERRMASEIDKELSTDPRLRAVAELFAQPAPCPPDSGPDRRRTLLAGAPARRLARPVPCLVLSVVVSVVALACCALLASPPLSVAAIVAGIVGVGVAAAFAVRAVHHRTRIAGVARPSTSASRSATP